MFGRKGLDVKTPDQIRKMRVAGVVVGETLELIRGQASAGMTTGDLDRTAEDFIRSKGATPSFLGYHGFTGSLCVSVNEEVVHGIPGSRTLRDGDLVSIDCGAIVDGWHGDAAISLIVGGREAGSARDLALMDATEASMWAGIAALAVGSPAVRRGRGRRGLHRRRRPGRRRDLRDRRGLRGSRHRHRDAPGPAGAQLPGSGPWPDREVRRHRGHRADGHPGLGGDRCPR